MDLFRKPVARVYIDELRKRMDPIVIPIFTPDIDLEVGDFGSFEDGRFVRRGNLADREIALDIREQEHDGFQFESSGKVHIGPTVTAGDLLEATVDFSKAKAVLASFQGGHERTVHDADAFGDTLGGLWARKQLKTNRAVVWSVRRATGGTIMVSESGGSQVKVMADPALLGGAAITLSGLSVGVDFGTERGSTWKMSTPSGNLVVWVRLLRLDPKTAQTVDGFAFEPGAPVPNVKPVPVRTDDVLENLAGED